MNSITRRTFLKGACVTAASLSIPGLVRATATMERARTFGSLDTPSKEEMYRVVERALRHGGDYADLYVESRATTNIRIADSEIKSTEYGVIQGGGVRTVRGEKTGYAYAETFDADDLLEVADTAGSMAEGEPRMPAPLLDMSFKEHIATQNPIEQATIADKIALLERIDRAARAVDPAIKQVTIGYRDMVQYFVIATSEGELAIDELPMIYLRVNVNAAKGGKTAEGMYRASERAGMEFLAGDMPERSGREAAEQALRMLPAVPAPTGELPVVVAAGGGVMFHEAVGHGLEADAVLRNISMFAGRIGQRVASERVTLFDDSTIPGARGSFNIDDEATPAAKTMLIDKGILAGYMQERRTARIMGAKLTGNGRRQSFRYPPLVRMTNTNVAPGVEDPNDIIRDTDRGVYAVHFGGGQVDTVTGEFTFGLQEAYMIERGKITAPIEGANLVGSGIQVLERIDRVGSDFGSWPGTCGKGQWVPVTSGCPTLRIARITIGGTAS